MNAQEWLKELERLKERATPGPWEAGEVLERGTVVRGHNMIIDCRHTPDKGCFGEHNAAYIVAACNAVPRLVGMVRYLAEEASGDAILLESGRWIEITPENMIEEAYKATEPKE